jgi:hypothetical protein
VDVPDIEFFNGKPPVIYATYGNGLEEQHQPGDCNSPRRKKDIDEEASIESTGSSEAKEKEMKAPVLNIKLENEKQ